MFSEVSTLLTKNYIKAGLGVDEYIVLNAYLNHSKLYHDNHDLHEVAELTGKTVDEITTVLSALVNKKAIRLTDSAKIDVAELHQSLSNIHRDTMSINQKIAESIEHYKHFRYDPYYPHMGQVTLLPFSKGGIVVTEGANNLYGGSIWDKEDMEKLANEILKFINQVDQDWIDNYNIQREEKLRAQKEQQENVYNERQAKKEQAAQPKSGFVILIRLYPSGFYKFTYTTSIDLNNKINRLKEEYGDNVEIVYSVETYDTMKFFYQFAKKQFSNRLVDNSHYDLTEEDIQFFKEEKYPANAMDWLEGSKVK